MRWLDRKLQAARIRRVVPYSSGARTLDIGCADGVLFRSLDDRLAGGVGIDMDQVPASTSKYQYVRGAFPAVLPPGDRFDLVVALAVVEHIPEKDQPGFAGACLAALRDGGRVVITVPSSRVDDILKVLKAIRVVDGMADHQHYGFNPLNAIAVFERAGFKLERHSRFQLGLNNLLVFRKPTSA
ncbi:MAG TPA: class I SAM-dependent methyltransferase [Candidatus Baltobacterales bacterium]|nr:class I SAM-dependent methyltransferase [Candidatus Baltobacterales bacterium]